MDGTASEKSSISPSAAHYESFGVAADIDDLHIVSGAHAYRYTRVRRG